MKRLVWLALALMVIAIGLSFAMLNPAATELDFYFGRLALPLSLWLVIAFALGALLGMVAALGIITKQRWQLARLRREVASSRDELSELRKLPIRNSP
ncbi:MAG: LapA family protein [Spiribacter sp.]|nr:LapA family protein [Spiribacter sp.]MDR9454104.1 LapA family protein [Spiribacter sp.]